MKEKEFYSFFSVMTISAWLIWMIKYCLNTLFHLFSRHLCKLLKKTPPCSVGWLFDKRIVDTYFILSILSGNLHSLIHYLAVNLLIDWSIDLGIFYTGINMHTHKNLVSMVNSGKLYQNVKCSGIYRCRLNLSWTGNYWK